jgi:hypothetical protein
MEWVPDTWWRLVTGTTKRQPVDRVHRRYLVLRRERGLHGRNVENNLQSDGESILESPEVHDRHIEATASALNGAVTSSDDRDTVAAIDNAFDGHMVL